MNSNRKEPSLLLWACIPAAICIALLWIPFGFSLGGMIEEWDLLWNLNKYEHFWNSFPGQPLSEGFAARPLQILPFYLAHLISPQSFFGFHLLLILICFLRITAAAVIGRYIFNDRFYGLVCGLLAFLMPADTQQLIFRTINISGALAFMLCGAALMLMAIEENRRIQRWLLVFGSMLVSITASFIYEPVMSLYLITPLAIFAGGGFLAVKETVKTRKKEIGVWLIAPLINIIYLFYAILIYKSSYQNSFLLNGSGFHFGHNFHYLFDSAVFRIFYDGWVDAARILFQQVDKWSFLFLCLLSLSLIIAIAGGRSQQKLKWNSLYHTLFVGFILFAVAYLPFMVSENHMQVIQRTLMASSFGASIIMVALLARFTKKLGLRLVIVTCALFLGFIAQLYQLDIYTRTYVNIIRPYMSMIVDKQDLQKNTHLIIDKTGLGGYFNGMFYTKVVYGPNVRLGEISGSYILCKENTPSKYMLYSQCTFENGLWQLKDAKGNVLNLSPAEVDVINIGDNFNPKYRSFRKWRDLGHFSEDQSIFSHRSSEANWYACVADSTWGYSDFCRGDGWTDGVFKKKFLSISHYFASFLPNPSLQFEMKPEKNDYQLQVQFGPVNASMLPKLRILINGMALPFQLNEKGVLEAQVLSSALKKGLNKIEFKNALIHKDSRGLTIQRVVLAPVGSRYLFIAKRTNFL